MSVGAVSEAVSVSVGAVSEAVSVSVGAVSECMDFTPNFLIYIIC